MTKTYFLHLDTAVNSTKINGNPFDCTVKLDKIHKNIKCIYLTSAEIPMSSYNIHSPLNVFTIDNTQYTLTEGNYDSTSIISALNALSVNGTFSIVNGFFQFVSSSGARTFTSVSPGDLAYCMGFVTDQTGSTIVAQNKYNLYADTFISIYFKNLSTSSSESKAISFKIPVDAVKNVIYYYTEMNNFTQFFEITDCSYLDRFQIQVRDRFGNVMNNNGVDWTFSLAYQT